MLLRKRGSRCRPDARGHWRRGRVPLGGAMVQAQRSAAAERVLRRLMLKAGVTGDVRDWACVSGNRLLDARQFYRLDTPATKTPVLVHKRDLHRYVGPDIAGMFWHRRLKIRLGGPHMQKGRNSYADGNE
jgi:hypothetical protein